MIIFDVDSPIEHALIGVHPSEMTHVQGKRALSGEKASSIGKALRDIPFQRSGT